MNRSVLFFSIVAHLSISLMLSSPAMATSEPLQSVNTPVECGSGFSSILNVRYAASPRETGAPQLAQLVFANDAKTKRELKNVLPIISTYTVGAGGKIVEQKILSTVVELALDTSDPRVKARNMLIFRDRQNNLAWSTDYFTMKNTRKALPNMLTKGNQIVAKYCKIAKRQ